MDTSVEVLRNCASRRNALLLCVLPAQLAVTSGHSLCTGELSHPIHSFAARRMQCHINLQGAIDAAEQAHSRNRPTAADEKTRKVFSTLVVILWLVQFRKKSIKIVATRCHISKLIKVHQIRFPLGLRSRPRWGADSAPQTP